MYVECFTDNGKPYLRLIQSVRITNKSGHKISQKQVVANIGLLDRFDDGQPDYVARLQNPPRQRTDGRLAEVIIILDKEEDMQVIWKSKSTKR